MRFRHPPYVFPNVLCEVLPTRLLERRHMSTGTHRIRLAGPGSCSSLYNVYQMDVSIAIHTFSMACIDEETTSAHEHGNEYGFCTEVMLIMSAIGQLASLLNYSLVSGFLRDAIA